MQEKDWIEILINQYQATMTFWHVYIAVALGAIGYVVQAGAKIGASNRKWLAIGWLIFAVSNLAPLARTHASLLLIHNKLEDHKEIFFMDPNWAVVLIHLIFDCAIFLFILRRKGNGSEVARATSGAGVL